MSRTALIRLNLPFSSTKHLVLIIYDVLRNCAISQVVNGVEGL